jgi:hypothetical protein
MEKRQMLQKAEDEHKDDDDSDLPDYNDEEEDEGAKRQMVQEAKDEDKEANDSNLPDYDDSEENLEENENIEEGEECWEWGCFFFFLFFLLPFMKGLLFQKVFRYT